MGWSGFLTKVKKLGGKRNGYGKIITFLLIPKNLRFWVELILFFPPKIKITCVQN